MRRLVLLLLLGCGLALREPYFRVFDDMACGNVLGERRVPERTAAEDFCSAQCMAMEECGGYSWKRDTPEQRCTLLAHEGVASECFLSKDSLTAVRDSRWGYVSLEDTTELAPMFLRCPSFMQVSSVLLAGLGTEQTHSPTVHRTVTEACLGRQACAMPFDSPGFLQSILAECDNGCTAISVQVHCEASSSFNEDAYFTSWSSTSWVYARNQVSTRRHEWQDQLRELPPYPTENRGKGVIIVAGGRYIEPALVLAMRLRELGFQHAIQLWHLGPEEVPHESLSLITSLQVETCDFLDYVTPEQLAPIPANVGLRRFQLKPLAMIHSSLQEILLLDADNSPLRNPAYLFELEEYKRTGAIFWPDYWTTSSSNPIWSLVDQEPSLEWEQESGQLLVDKARTWKALQLCVLMNSEFYMRLLNGDKDTFRFAWRATRTPYHMISSWPATLGIGLGTFGNQSHLCGHTMLQHDTTGAPLFVHHNQMKDLVLPLGLNFRYLQRRNGPCRAAPRTGFEHDGSLVPCFTFVSPHMPYVDNHLMPVERAHLELFELKYAMARRKVLRQLGWSLTGRTTTSPMSSRSHAFRRSVLPSFGNSTNQTFVVEGNITESATVCVSSNETSAPTNITDRLCKHIPAQPLLINVSLVGSPLVSGQSVFTVEMEPNPVAVPRANISLIVGFTYAFLASVPEQVGLIITRQKDGGAGSTSIPEAQGPSPAHSRQIVSLVADFSLDGNASLYYESPTKLEQGGKITMAAANFEVLPANLRLGAAFDPNALLFTLQSNSNNVADLAVECRRRCALDPIVARDCKGYYILVTPTAAKCKGLTYAGEPTPTLLGLQSQSWVKVPVKAPAT